MSLAVDPQIAAWQADQHEIGMIQFFAPDSAKDQFPYHELPTSATFLGLLEADALCLMDDGTLIVYDHEVPNRVFCNAAASQLAFVSALAVLEEYFDECAADDSFDEARAVTIRERCTEIAGGDQYGGFFSTMLGV